MLKMKIYLLGHLNSTIKAKLFRQFNITKVRVYKENRVKHSKTSQKQQHLLFVAEETEIPIEDMSPEKKKRKKRKKKQTKRFQPSLTHSVPVFIQTHTRSYYGCNGYLKDGRLQTPPSSVLSTAHRQPPSTTQQRQGHRHYLRCLRHRNFPRRQPKSSRRQRKSLRRHRKRRRLGEQHGSGRRAEQDGHHRP